MLLPLLLNNLLYVSNSYSITAEQGIYSVSGTANLIKTKKIVADQNSYSFTGQDVNFSRLRKITANSGVYSLSGIDANLLSGIAYTIQAGSTSYSLIGSAGLFKNSKIYWDGSYSLIGNSVSLKKALKLASELGIYNLTGDTSFQVSKGFNAEIGQFTITSIPNGFVWLHVLTCDSGSYNISGNVGLLLNIPEKEFKSYLNNINKKTAYSDSISKQSKSNNTITANSFARNINLDSFSNEKIEA